MPFSLCLMPYRELGNIFISFDFTCFRSPFLSRPVIISPLSNTKYRQLKINQNRSQILDKRLFWNHFLDLANALKRRRSKLMPAKKMDPFDWRNWSCFPSRRWEYFVAGKMNLELPSSTVKQDMELIFLNYGFLLPRGSEFRLCRIQVGNPSPCSKFSYWAPKSTVTFGTAWVKVL